MLNFHLNSVTFTLHQLSEVRKCGLEHPNYMEASFVSLALYYGYRVLLKWAWKEYYIIIILL